VIVLLNFKGKTVCNGECRVLKVICGSHNHELTNTLVGHPDAKRLKSNAHFMFLNMIKSLVMSTMILLTLKETMKNNKASV